MNNINKKLIIGRRIGFAIVGILSIVIIINDIYRFFSEKDGIIYNFKYGTFYGSIFVFILLLISINLIFKAVGYNKVFQYIDKIKKNK